MNGKEFGRKQPWLNSGHNLNMEGLRKTTDTAVRLGGPVPGSLTVKQKY
jgi:hypothetical protein